MSSSSIHLDWLEPIVRVQSLSSPIPLDGGLCNIPQRLSIRGSATSSPLLSPSDEIEDDLVKVSFHFFSNGSVIPSSLVNTPISGPRTVGRWLKDRREKKKEEDRVHNAQLHAAVSVAAMVAAKAAVTTVTEATSSSMSLGRNNEQMVKMDMAVASAATLVAAQSIETVEAMGAEREHLASVISSAVNVRTHDDVTTLAAATATCN